MSSPDENNDRVECQQQPSQQPPSQLQQLRERPQYYYFYGSTAASYTDNNNPGVRRHSSDQDSLLAGEALVPTDNEADDDDDDTRMASNSNSGGAISSMLDGILGDSRSRGGGGGDYQQLILTEGSNVHTIPGGSGDGDGGSSAAYQHNYSHHHVPRNRHHHNQDRGVTYPTHRSLLQRARQDTWPTILQRAVYCGAILLASLIAIAVVFPNSRAADVLISSSSTTSSIVAPKAELNFQMPFPQVDRGQYGDPVDGFLHKELIHPSLWGDQSTGHTFTFPFPTGAFWSNLVLDPTADQGISYPVAVYPYAYKWSLSLLQLCYPKAHRVEDARSIHDYFFPDLTLSARENTIRRYVKAFDPLSVTLHYETEKDGSWETYLVQGSPYMTVKYKDVAPTVRAFSIFQNVYCPRDPDGDLSLVGPTENRLNTRRRQLQRRQLKFGDCTVTDTDGGSSFSSSMKTLKGVQFILHTQEGLYWMIFASEPISWVFDQRAKTTVVATRPYTGVLRWALVPGLRPFANSTTMDDDDDDDEVLVISESMALQRLIYHAGAYSTRASVRWSFHSDPVLPKTTTTAIDFTSSALATVVASKSVHDNKDANDDKSSTSSAANNTSTVPSTNTETASLGNIVSKNQTASSPSPSSTSYAKQEKTTTTPPAQRSAKIEFHFQIETFVPSTGTTASEVPLLMLALPHHTGSIVAAAATSTTTTTTQVLGPSDFELVYQCIKGSMTPVVGSSWSYLQQLPSSTLGVDGDIGSNGETFYLEPAFRSILIENLKDDVKQVLPTRTEDVYGFGKQSARLAQLAHIANLLGGGLLSSQQQQTNSSSKPAMTIEDMELAELYDQTIKTLSSSLEDFLTSNVSDSLVYDKNLGGVVSTDGLRNPNADFGNGRYNDHHFHYGYILYACAIMGELRPEFVRLHGDSVDAIYYDLAHDSFQGSSTTSDNSGGAVFYPFARYKSWFDGHSFASGLFPFGDGKSQESSSEAVNGYYGAYLWSVVRSGNSAKTPWLDTSSRTDFARLLLAMEINGARWYWHMSPDGAKTNSNNNMTIQSESLQAVYDDTFSKNYMVGNLGMMDAVCSTWFSTEVLYVHMINFMPLTAATGELFGVDYVTEEYTNILKNQEVEMAWQGYVVADHGIIDPNAALIEALDLFSPQLDSALSKSQVLYWILTRKGFDATQTQSLLPPSGGPDVGSSQCTSYPACAGLSGECCPTADGVYLGCCSACSNYASCSALQGSCCPTNDGTFLGCCS